MYIAYRVAYLWDTFSGWHMAGFGLIITVYVAAYSLFVTSARPKYDAAGKLTSGGTDLFQPGLLECVASDAPCRAPQR